MVRGRPCLSWLIPLCAGPFARDVGIQLAPPDYPSVDTLITSALGSPTETQAVGGERMSKAGTDDRRRGLTRRQALGAAAAGAGALALESARAKADLASSLALLGPACGKLTDIEHVIFL